MNASLALCAAVLSALPTAGTAPGRSSVYDAGQSERFAAVIRGQAPMTDMPAPTFSPAPQGMIYGGAPGPVVGQGAPIYGDPYGAAPIGPDPFLGSDPGYMPGGGFPEGRWGWYVGYDNMFIKPVFDKNPDAINLLGIPLTIQNTDWGYEYAPRIWLGIVEPDGNGFQAKYWRFDDSASSSGAKQTLEMDVLDLDKTWHYNLQRSALSVGAGVRLASIDQSLRSPVAAAGVNFASLNTKGSFDGVGPTLSISGRKRVSNTNWALFASTRLSALFGDSSSSAVLAGPIPFATEDDGDDLMAVTELQMGVDWSAPVWYSTRLFIRAAMEGQIWHGGGNPGFPLLSTTDGDLGFFGFTLGTGLTY